MLSSRPPSVLLRGSGAAALCPNVITAFRSRPAAALRLHQQQHDHHRRPHVAAASLSSSSPSSSSRAAEALGGDLLPQNTGNPLALPSPSQTALEAAAAQLDALAGDKLNDPWPLHGVAVAYAYCADSGSLELSRYFAPMKTSLYHQDHFQGKFLTRYPGLVGHNGWEVLEVAEEDDGVVVVKVSVAPSSAAAAAGAAEEERQTYVLVLVRQEAGLRKGSWVTKQLVRLGPDGAPV